jgi:hypothetical protein
VALRDLFESFQATLDEYCRATGLDRSPTCEFSSGHISDQNSPPRVIMVPTSGIIGASVGQAGFFDDDATPQVHQRALWARRLRLEFRIWGRNFDECEALMNHVAAVLHDLAWGGDAPVSEDWTKGQSANAKAGVLVVLAMTVEIPLVREPVPIVTLTDFAPMTKGFDAILEGP